MSDGTHPDDVRRLRGALWGDADVERHAESCPACGRDMEFHRRLRDSMRRWTDAAPPARAMDAVVDAARTGGVPEMDVTWLKAAPAADFAGARGAGGADLRVVRGDDGLRVDVILHPMGAPGGVSAAGQVVRSDGSPLARAEITLFVDGRPHAKTTTDDFGEFEFEAARAGSLGLRVGSGTDATHVEILPGGEIA